MTLSTRHWFSQSSSSAFLILFSVMLTHVPLVLKTDPCLKKEGYHLSFLRVYTWKPTSECKLQPSRACSEVLLTKCSRPLLNQQVWGLSCVKLSKWTFPTPVTCPAPLIFLLTWEPVIPPLSHSHHGPFYFCLNDHIFQTGWIVPSIVWICQILLGLVLLIVPGVMAVKWIYLLFHALTHKKSHWLPLLQIKFS